MLTSEEVQAVLGESIKDVRRNEKIEGILTVTQCLFELPTMANTIVLTVTQKVGDPEARDPRDIWRETFLTGQPNGPKGRRKVTPPTPIQGLGDGAFWTGRRAGGGLYVLKGNSYFRISVGGREEPDAKIDKCKALAEKVLAKSFVAGPVAADPAHRRAASRAAPNLA